MTFLFPSTLVTIPRVGETTVVAFGTGFIDIGNGKYRRKLSQFRVEATLVPAYPGVCTGNVIYVL